MSTISRRLAALSLGFLVCSSAAGWAQPIAFGAHGSASPFATESGSLLCVDGECQAAITTTTYLGHEAYRLTDGRTQAIVVPDLGRIMSYGKVGGSNLLWNAPTTTQWKATDWKNYGGDKTWLAPQSAWGVLSDKQWPPDAALDGTPHEAEVLTGGKLKLVSGTSKTSGIRIERVMGFNAAGEFEIEQSAIKTAGTPVRVGLWDVTQSVPAQAIFARVSSTSPYENKFFRFETQATQKQPASVTDGILRIEPQRVGGGQKFGIDSPVATLVSVRDGVAWVQKSAKSAGEYPDGTEKHGFPVEVYVYGDSKAYYVELEMLGPLVNMVKGQKMTHTVRWSLADLPSADLNASTTQTAIAALLQ